MKNKCIYKKIDVTIDKNHIIEFNNDYNFSNFLEILQKDYENYKKLISNKNNELSELFNKTKNHREKIKNKNIYIDNDYLFNSMLCVVHGSWGSGKSYFLDKLGHFIYKNKKPFSFIKINLMTKELEINKLKNKIFNIIFWNQKFWKKFLFLFLKILKLICYIFLFIITLFSSRFKLDKSDKFFRICSIKLKNWFLKNNNNITIIVLDNIERLGKYSHEIIINMNELLYLDNFIFVIPTNLNYFVTEFESTLNDNLNDELFLKKFINSTFLFKQTSFNIFLDLFNKYKKNERIDYKNNNNCIFIKIIHIIFTNFISSNITLNNARYIQDIIKDNIEKIEQIILDKKSTFSKIEDFFDLLNYKFKKDYLKDEFIDSKILDLFKDGKIKDMLISEICKYFEKNFIENKNIFSELDDFLNKKERDINNIFSINLEKIKLSNITSKYNVILIFFSFIYYKNKKYISFITLARFIFISINNKYYFKNVNTLLNKIYKNLLNFFNSIFGQWINKFFNLLNLSNDLNDYFNFFDNSDIHIIKEKYTNINFNLQIYALFDHISGCFSNFIKNKLIKKYS